MQINRISAVSGNFNKTNNNQLTSQATTSGLTNPLKKDEVSFGHSSSDFIDSVIEEAAERASKEGKTVKQFLRNRLMNDDFSSAGAERAARRALDRLEGQNPFDYD